MWGICHDWAEENNNIFQKAIEYEPDPDGETANLLQPVKDAKVPIKNIMTPDKPPAFVYGDLVSPTNHPDMIGKIYRIQWHYKNNSYNYYITVNDRKKSKRYYEEDLIKR